MTKALGIIPARWASTRFPGKPLSLIAGKPLLRHVWERSQRAKSLDSVIIATDDMRIAEAAFSWGAEVSLTSSRHRSGTDRIAEVASKAKQFGYIINVQGDEPLIDPRLIDRLVRKLRSNSEIEIVTAAHPFENEAHISSPNQVKVMVDRKGVAIDFTRSGAFPSAEAPDRRLGNRHSSRVLRHQGIYGFRRAALLQFVQWKPTLRERAESLEQLRALENGVRISVVVTASGSPGVDTPEDAKAIERKLRPTKQRAARQKRRV